MHAKRILLELMELGVGVTGPHMWLQEAPCTFLPYLAPCVASIPPDTTGIMTIPTWNRRESEACDHQGQKITCSGNQHSIITDIIKIRDNSKERRLLALSQVAILPHLTPRIVC
uniref:Uncharacterized protein n=1 Tax=Eutreptiella gymnastica TaxID=73025 RepID=A0A6U7X6E7_9EUGL|mmetsp:Transcript_13904/g.24861  ORF Transcript_13904/g.24861 Transcript_13904/m.24861 type:complete len:114 (+) Transcript_13904:70-411(+)